MACQLRCGEPRSAAGSSFAPPGRRPRCAAPPRGTGMSRTFQSIIPSRAFGDPSRGLGVTRAQQRKGNVPARRRWCAQCRSTPWPLPRETKGGRVRARRRQASRRGAQVARPLPRPSERLVRSRDRAARTPLRTNILRHPLAPPPPSPGRASQALSAGGPRHDQYGRRMTRIAELAVPRWFGSPSKANRKSIEQSSSGESVSCAPPPRPHHPPASAHRRRVLHTRAGRRHHHRAEADAGFPSCGAFRRRL